VKPDLWRKKAAEAGRERKKRPERKVGEGATANRRNAGKAWAVIAGALRASAHPADQRLALEIERFVTGRTLDRPIRKEPIRMQPEPRREIERGR